MGRIVSIILLIGVLLASMGGGQPDNTAEDTVIDYGESGMFSLEDRQEAVSLILARTGRWRSLEHLHTVRYGGDAASLEEKGSSSSRKRCSAWPAALPERCRHLSGWSVRKADMNCISPRKR